MSIAAAQSRDRVLAPFRLTSEPLAKEILDAWFDQTELDPTEVPNIEKVKQAASKERWAPVRAALKQAAELRDRGKRDEAEAIWHGIEALYHDDPGAAEILQAVAAARKQE